MLLPARLLARAAALSRRRAQQHSTSSDAAAATATTKQRRGLPDDQKSLGDFLAAAASSSSPSTTSPHTEEPQMLAYAAQAAALLQPAEPRTFTIESYGCQMNSADSEIVRAIMEGANYQWTDSTDAADVIYLNTCAIRDNAEQRVFGRLASLRGMYKPTRKSRQQPRALQRQRERKVVGVLGCMAERLKARLLEEDAVDLVAGPDAYRDLPRLLGLVGSGNGAAAINVQLSQEETYADVAPVRIQPDQAGAFVSIMRGCNNMCSFCIVPHTRGRERSRPVGTILEEVRRLSGQGIKEVVLLGQNVNSYHDTSAPPPLASLPSGGEYQVAEGFSNMYRLRGGQGVYFVDLLDQVSRVDPEMRVRFTSPHPKDFPVPLLQLIAERPSLCSSLHLPAQSGSTDVLRRMRRGYTREAYLALAERAREAIPGVALSSDFISGFCGESEADHRETLSLMEAVGYEQAFMFAYSRRERTHAAYHLGDDVPEQVKQRRLREIIEVFRRRAGERNAAEVGTTEHLVLVEGHSKRSTEASPTLTGRTDSNKRCVFPAVDVLADADDAHGPRVQLQAGDYAVVRVAQGRAQTLLCEAVGRSSIGAFEARKGRRRQRRGAGGGGHAGTAAAAATAGGGM